MSSWGDFEMESVCLRIQGDLQIEGCLSVWDDSTSGQEFSHIWDKIISAAAELQPLGLLHFLEES